jgi:hypothetical protein
MPPAGSQHGAMRPNGQEQEDYHHVEHNGFVHGTGTGSTIGGCK